MCSASAKAPISNTNSPAQWWLYSDQAMSAALRGGAASSPAAKARDLAARRRRAASRKARVIGAFQLHRPARFDPLDDLGERGAILGRSRAGGNDVREAAQKIAVKPTRSRLPRSGAFARAASRDRIAGGARRGNSGRQKQQAAQQRDLGAKHDAI